jgi:hypothetical protein
MMKVWITKYALTKGIYAIEAKAFDDEPDLVKQTYPVIFWGFFHKPDWHESKGEAVTRAETMRQAKFQSLHKQIKKLEALEFKI